MRRIARLGVISARGTGAKRTLPAAARSTQVEVVAIHGRNREALLPVASRFNVARTFTDLWELAESGTIDVAVVCSPPFVHLEQAEILLGAGIPTLFEKPLAHTLSDAQAIVAMSKKYGVRVGVAHQLRFHPAYEVVRRLLNEGVTGIVEAAFAEWSFTLDPSSDNARWKLDGERNGQTAFSDTGVHCVDTLIGLFGACKVLAAQEVGKPEAGWPSHAVDVLAGFADGNGALIRSSWRRGPFSNRLTISGRLGELNAERFFTESGASTVSLVTAQGEHRFDTSGGDPYRLEMEDFVAFAQRRSRHFGGPTLDEALNACEVVDRVAEMVR